jgi:hypothetical protein
VVLVPGKTPVDALLLGWELALELPLLHPAMPSTAEQRDRLMTPLRTGRTRHCYPARLNRPVSSREYG